MFEEQAIREPRGRQLQNASIVSKLSDGRGQSVVDSFSTTVGVAFQGEGKLVEDAHDHCLAS